jgi:thioredoxin-like negative regulator of GroEL
MAERLLMLLALAAAVALGYALLRWRQARQLRMLAPRRLFADLAPQGRPAVVAFSLPSCGECRARQAPALERLRAQVGETAHVLTLRADEHVALVAELGLLTVPSSVVLDAAGQVRAINQGFADESRLLEQLAAMAPVVPGVSVGEADPVSAHST